MKGRIFFSKEVLTYVSEPDGPLWTKEDSEEKKKFESLWPEIRKILESIYQERDVEVEIKAKKVKKKETKKSSDTECSSLE